MLSCHDLAHDCASDYIDGHLEWRKRIAVVFHLFICVNCRRFLRQLKQVKWVLLRRPINAKGLGRQRVPEVLPEDHDYLGKLASQLLAEYNNQNSGN